MARAQKKRQLRVDVRAYPARVAHDLHLFHITGGGCTAGWAGEDRAQCGRCHLTHDSIPLYDAHRPAAAVSGRKCSASCRPKNGIWGQPS
jgi:hypothetical protein